MKRFYYPRWRTACALAITALMATTGVVHAQVAQVIEFSPAVADGDVDEFSISPDGTMIAFVGSLVGDATDQAYVAPIGGGAAIRITPVDAGETDGAPVWMPDGSGVIVRYDKGLGNINNNYFLLPSNGSMTETQLTFSPTNDFDAQVTPDGLTLLFSDNGDDGTTDLDDLVYRASIATPGPATLVTPDDITEIDTGSYAQLGTDIVFASTTGAGNGAAEDRFYIAPIFGLGAPVEIPVNNVPAAGDIDELMLTPDGSSIIFVADLTNDNVDELYSIPIAGGDATALLPNIQDFTDVGAFVISADGLTIAFQADYRTNGEGEIYTIPITGGDPVRISQDLSGLAWNADVLFGTNRMAFTPDGLNLIYTADGRFSNVNELFMVSVVPVPEPSTVLLSMFITLGIVLKRRDRRIDRA